MVNKVKVNETKNLTPREVFDKEEHRRKINYGKLKKRVQNFLNRINPLNGTTFIIESGGKVTSTILDKATREIYGKVFKEVVTIGRQPLRAAAIRDREMKVILSLGAKGISKKEQAIFYGEVKREE